MPRGDRTGPWGQGPMTGRGAGYCAGYDAPGYANPGPGYGYGYGRGMGFGRRGGGFGRGRGRGFGWGPGFPPAPAWGAPFYGPVPGPTAEQEMTLLEAQAGALRQELEALDARLSELRDMADEATKDQGE